MTVSRCHITIWAKFVTFNFKMDPSVGQPERQKSRKATKEGEGIYSCQMAFPLMSIEHNFKKVYLFEN